jgi:hypothetical protein
MNGGLTKGSSADIIDYLFKAKLSDGGGSDQPDRGVLLGGTVLGDSVGEIKQAFQRLLSLRPDITRAMQTVWVSCPRGESGRLNPVAKLWICEQLAISLGWDAWVAVDHPEGSGGSCPHFHAAGCRISWDGTSVSPEYLRDYALVEAVMKRAEIKFRLSRTPKPERPERPHGRSRNRPKDPRSIPERKMAKAGRESMKAQLLRHLRECDAAGLRGHHVLIELGKRGWASDVRWRPGGIVSGLVWTHRQSGKHIPMGRLGLGGGAAWLRSIGGIPGMHHGAGLDRNWTPKPYRPTVLAPRSRLNPGVAGGCGWWSRAMSWMWQATTKAVESLLAPQDLASHSASPAIPPHGPTRTQQEITPMSPRRR